MQVSFSENWKRKDAMITMIYRFRCQKITPVRLLDAKKVRFSLFYDAN